MEQSVQSALGGVMVTLNRQTNALGLLQLQVARLERILEEIHEVKFGTHVTTGNLGNWKETNG